MLPRIASVVHAVRRAHLDMKGVPLILHRPKLEAPPHADRNSLQEYEQRAACMVVEHLVDPLGAWGGCHCGGETFLGRGTDTVA